jgi:fatty acid desaturase
MIQNRQTRKDESGGMSMLVLAAIGGALGGLTVAPWHPEWRPYWHLIMLGGAAAGTLAVTLLDFNDFLFARRRSPDNGQLAPTLQSLLLAFMIFAIIMIVCAVLVFAH